MWFLVDPQQLGELDALKEEKAKVEEELEKEKEGTDEKLKTQKDMVIDMRNKVETLLEEKEALRKRLTETVEKLETANSLLELQDEREIEVITDEESTDDEDEVEPSSIESAIVGTWQNPLNSKETTVLRLNDVILTETTTTASTESYCKDWVLNNPNFEFSAQSYAHTFFENNQLITIIRKKETGEEWCWIKRTLKDGQLRVVMTKGKESTPSVDITYDKVKLNVNVC